MKEIIAKLDNMVAIQADSITDEYMRGYYNGIVVARSVVTQQEPIFKDYDYPKLGIATDRGEKR